MLYPRRLLPDHYLSTAFMFMVANNQQVNKIKKKDVYDWSRKEV